MEAKFIEEYSDNYRPIKPLPVGKYTLLVNVFFVGNFQSGNKLTLNNVISKISTLTTPVENIGYMTRKNEKFV